MRSTPLAMLARNRTGCAWLRAPTGLKGFDRAAFGGTPKVSGRKASRHINPSPPARVEQKACWTKGAEAPRD
jgi:hypothetical protein